MTRTIGLFACILLIVAAPLRAQGAPGTVRVHVTDSLRVPVVGADAMLSRGDSVVARARTDSTGNATLRAPAPASYELQVRRLGFDHVDQSVDLHPSGPLTLVEVELTRLVQRIGPVAVTDSRLPLDKRPYVDAAEIAASSRTLLSLDDVIGKLRPNIAYQVRRCLPLPRSGPVDSPLIPRAFMVHPLMAVVYVNGKKVPREWNPWDSIHAEHIQEIQYVNCLDGSIPGLPRLPWAAVYVVLKPGYDWDPGHGSFAVDSLTMQNVSVPTNWPSIENVTGTTELQFVDTATKRTLADPCVGDLLDAHATNEKTPNAHASLIVILGS